MSIAEAPNRSAANPVAAAVRGERLYPPRHSRIFWHLTCLRTRMEEMAEHHLRGRHRSLLVDYGCGNMPYRPILEPHVEQYVGIDLSGNDRADRIMHDLHQAPVESGEADVVLSTQVLEHVLDPQGYLREAHRMLRPGGLLVLSTHGLWPYHPDPYDLWRWTGAGLRRTIAAEGFEIVSCRGILGPASTALQLWQDAVYARVRGFFRKPFTRLMQWLIRRVDLACSEAARDADGGTYLVVARKV
jgi:SAM-dependent methyltransferase